MTVRVFRPSAATLGLALALGACSTDDLPPCPPVYILSDAKDVTKFRPGSGQDLADIVAKAEIVGYHGTCEYKKPDNGKGWNVDLELQVAIQAWRGPANTTHSADLSYFVAIPYFYPKDQAKAVFPLRVQFPAGSDQVRGVDQPIHMTIPIGDKDAISKYVVYLGFQTTRQELEHNRKDDKDN